MYQVLWSVSIVDLPSYDVVDVAFGGNMLEIVGYGKLPHVTGSELESIITHKSLGNAVIRR